MSHNTFEPKFGMVIAGLDMNVRLFLTFIAEEKEAVFSFPEYRRHYYTI